MTDIRGLMTVLALLAAVNTAQGYLVSGAVKLDKLTAEADVIFKGVAGTWEPVGANEPFRTISGFHVRDTRFKVISVLKGDGIGQSVTFRHYDGNAANDIIMYSPQSYHFEAGRAYLVFAKRGSSPGTLQQIWMSHRLRYDQGVVLCADARPIDAATVERAVWDELTKLLALDGDCVVYAIRQLDEMSNGGRWWSGTDDYKREDVLAELHGLMRSDDAAIAQAAIAAVGSHNPYMIEEEAQFWLATVGSAKAPGLGTRDKNMRNLGGELYRDELVALADDRGRPGETRALAVRALGLVRAPAIAVAAQRWSNDAEPAVRAAAAVLMADYPGAASATRLGELANDPSPQVRVGVARAVGFGQMAGLADVLNHLMADGERKVREAAAMSLLSFLPQDDDAIARIFRGQLDNAEFAPLFLNALAAADPATYRDALADVVAKRTEPPNFWGGTIPAFVSWEILFKYLRAQPVDEVRSGRLDRYLDAIEKVEHYSSSEPRDVYAFYVQRMMARALRYRAAAKAAATYDIEQYFDAVDKDPSQFTREGY